MKKYIYFLIPVYALYIFGMFYVMLQPLNWHAPAFWKFLALSAGPLLVLLIVFSFTKRQIDSFQNWRSSFHNKNAVNLTSEQKRWGTICKASILALMFVVVFPLHAFSMQRHSHRELNQRMWNSARFRRWISKRHRLLTVTAPSVWEIRLWET